MPISGMRSQTRDVMAIAYPKRAPKQQSRPASSTTKAKEFSALRHSAEDAAELLRAIGSAHRLMILCLLMDGAKSVSEICEALDARQSLVSQHLLRLRQDRLVHSERHGHFVHYSLAETPARDIIGILQAHFCPEAGRTRN